MCMWVRDIDVQTIEMRVRFASEPQMIIIFIKKYEYMFFSLKSVGNENQRQQKATPAVNEKANVAEIKLDVKEKPNNNLRVNSVQRSSHRQSREYEDAFNGNNTILIRARRGRDRSAEAHDNVGLILQPINKTSKHLSKSVYSDEYKSRKGDRFNTLKPLESDIWKKQGKLVAETVSHQDYDQKTGERYAIRRPQDSDIIQGDGMFIGETQTRVSFTPKKGERYETTRPQTSDLWKRRGKLETDTVAHLDYCAQKGERYPTVIPTDSNILFGDDNLTTAKLKINNNFTTQNGKRLKTVQPEASNICKDENVAHHDYKRLKGERYPIKKPQDSNILYGDGTFASETHTNAEFTAKIGERYDIKRPVESEIWKQHDNMAEKNGSKQNFIAKRGGERYRTIKPGDSNLLRSNESEMNAKTELTRKKDDRCVAVQRSNKTGLWKNDIQVNNNSQPVKDYDTMKQVDSNTPVPGGLFVIETEKKKENIKPKKLNDISW
uniref:Uncharacterized protein n=1 Tax=Setaria digitata TaxID=48799 RepID=A0A915PLM7_9BILA